MKSIIGGLGVIFSRRDGVIVLSVSTLVLLILLFAVWNGSAAFDMLTITSLSLGSRVLLFLKIFFDGVSNFSVATLTLSVVGSFLGGVNFTLAYVYFRIRGEALFHSGLYNGVGLLLAYFGVGCAACGTAFVGVLFSALGLTPFLHMLPFGGEEFGVVGLIILTFATYSLSKKVIAPLVC